MKLLDLPTWLRESKRQTRIEDHFWAYASASGLCPWTTAATSVGGESVAVSATLLGGQLVLTTGGTTANQAGFYSTTKGFKAVNNEPLLFECSLQYVDASSHNAGLYLGFSDVLNGTGASSPLITNGTLTKASMTAFGFYKLAGTTNWGCLSQVTTTVTSNTSNIAADDASGSVFHTFRIEVQFPTSTTALATFFIDGVQCVDNTTLLPVKHTITFGSTAMYVGATCVAGNGNSQTPALDYLAAYMLNQPTLA